MIVALTTIILIVIISITASGRKGMTSLEVMTGNTITPIQKVFSNISTGISNTIDSVINSFTLKSENAKLKEEVSILKDKVRKYENVVSRETYLKNEYELIQSTKYDLVKASIVGKDPGNWFEKFVIDKGSSDGIKKGDIIIQATEINEDVIVEGLVGKVIEVGDRWSKVMSIIDGGSGVSFIVARNQDGGVGKGNLDGKIEGQLFDINSGVVKGDSVYTSGLGGVFPKDIYIGQVDKVTKKSGDLLIEVQIKPSVSFNKLRDIFIIRL